MYKRQGYTSVMIDGSKLDFEDNIRETRRVADVAAALDIPCEAEPVSYTHLDVYKRQVLTQSELYEKTVSNMLECKSRGAYLMGLTTYCLLYTSRCV